MPNYLSKSIFTFIIITSKNGVFPSLHVLKMKTGLKMVDSMGRSYGWFEDMKAVSRYMDQVNS
jgi:hypothetical protein